MDDKDEGGSLGSKQSKMASELAQGAARLARALDGVMDNLSGLPKDDEMRRKLTDLRLAFEMQRLRALDIASGASDRRKRPLVEALAAARGEGTEEAWSKAMACLAQYALDESRPAWYAGAMLAHLGVDVALLSREAARELAVPIDLERGLASPSYQWDWPATVSSESQAMWRALAARAGVAG